MPLYDYECECGKVLEAAAPMSESSKSIDCTCGQEAKRIITLRQAAPKFTDKLYPFHHDGLGEVVHSSKDIHDKCKANGFASPHEDCSMSSKQEKTLLASRDRVNRFQNHNKHRKV